MGSRPKTLKEYAALLGVGSSASRDEIALALALRKHEARTTGRGPTEQQLREAFEALTNLDAAGSAASRGEAALPPRRHAAPVGQRSVGTPALLFASLGALAGVVAFLVWPLYGYHLRSFEANDRLVEERTGRPYGTVLDVSERHVFPNGKSGPAYRVRLAEGGSEVWLPATDVKFVCVKE
jgi:hypothetical protein